MTQPRQPRMDALFDDEAWCYMTAHPGAVAVTTAFSGETLRGVKFSSQRYPPFCCACSVSSPEFPPPEGSQRHHHLPFKQTDQITGFKPRKNETSRVWLPALNSCWQSWEGTTELADKFSHTRSSWSTSSYQFYYNIARNCQELPFLSFHLDSSRNLLPHAHPSPIQTSSTHTCASSAHLQPNRTHTFSFATLSHRFAYAPREERRSSLGC